MKLTNSEWQTLCTILEKRGYRYSDSGDAASGEYDLFSNINKRIAKSAEGSTQRFTAAQKAYLVEMLEEYQTYNTAYASEAEKADIATMLLKLAGRKPIDLCDIMCG